MLRFRTPDPECHLITLIVICSEYLTLDNPLDRFERSEIGLEVKKERVEEILREVSVRYLLIPRHSMILQNDKIRGVEILDLDGQICNAYFGKDED